MLVKTAKRKKLDWGGGRWYNVRVSKEQGHQISRTQFVWEQAHKQIVSWIFGDRANARE